MTEIPMKLWWYGRDVDDLSREDLVILVHELTKKIEFSERMLRTTLNIDQAVRGARTLGQ